MNSQPPGSRPGALTIELRPQRRRLESNQRERALQARALPLGHVVTESVQRAAQGSNLSPLGLEPSVPPLVNSRRVRDRTGRRRSMRRKGLEPSKATGAGSFTGCCNRRSATCAWSSDPALSSRLFQSQRGRIRTSNPVLPRHVRYQVTLHADLRASVAPAARLVTVPGGS